jgi:endonuclease III
MTIKSNAAEILHRLSKGIPNPQTELNYRTTFEFLVAVILSAQATDKSVNNATKDLFKIANTPEKILKLGEQQLKKHIKTIGLYNAKAKNVIKMCEMLITKFHSQVPDNATDLESLPGVGRKTANVVLNVIFGKPTIAVDTHVFRVCNRTKLAVGKTPAIVEEKLLKIIPEELRYHAGHLLLLHGRYTCTAKNPHCRECVIEELCHYEHKNK